MKQRATATLIVALAALILFGGQPSRARIAEPDFTFYGNATIDGVAIPGSLMTPSTIRVELDDQSVCSMTLPPSCVLASISVTMPTSTYVLRIPIDTLEPRVRPSGRPGESVKFYINGTLAGMNVIGGAGDALRLDIDTNFQVASLSVEPIELFEGNAGTSQALFTVRLVDANGDPVAAPSQIDFSFSTANPASDPALTATPGADYTPVSDGVASIGSGQMSTNVAVNILGDIDDTEGDERFRIVLSDIAGPAVIRPDPQDRADGLIRDDDLPPVVSIAATSVMESGVMSVDATFTVTLSRPFHQLLNVGYTTDAIGASAVAGQDYVPTTTSVQFGIGEVSKPIDIEVLADSINEPDETFFVQLTNAGAATLSPTAARAQGTILDDERFLTWIEEEKNGVNDGAGQVAGLDAAIFATVAPDGQALYVAGRFTDPLNPGTAPVGAIATFRRGTPAPAGELAYGGVVVQNDATGVKLGGVGSLALSPDNRSLYAAGTESGVIVRFNRNLTTEALTYANQTMQNGVGGVTGLGGAASVVVSSDSKHVYAAGSADGAIVVFGRDSINCPGAACGTLTYLQTRTDAPIVGQPDVLLRGVSALALSPDGTRLYAAARLDNAVSIFARNTGTGLLTRVGAVQDGVAGVNGLALARGVAVSPDNEHVYVTGQGGSSLAIFRRGGVAGMITPPLQVLVDDTNGVDGLEYVQGVAAGSDGKYVFAAGFEDDAISVFRRDHNPSSPGYGTLSFLEIQRDEIANVAGLARAASIAVSSDSRQDVYVAGVEDDAVAVFFREFNKPTSPTLLDSPSHVEGDYVSDSTIDLVWSGATDEAGGSGLAGYSIGISAASGTLPDTFVDVAHASDPNTKTLAPQADGLWFVAVRTCDTGSNCADAPVAEIGPLGIDTIAPAKPTNLAAPGQHPCTNTINLTWNAVNDPVGSGLDGYSVSFTMSAGSLCSGVVNAVAPSVGSGPLADGVYFAHVCAVDHAGNKSLTEHLGPLAITATLDTDSDTIADCVDTCVDVDQDGSGRPGNVSGCPNGPLVDCNDAVDSVFPGAPEICDGFDSNCDSVTPPEEVDTDLDGAIECDGDCEPTNAEISPLIHERCRNTIDDNCDDVIDGDDSYCESPICLAVTLGAAPGDDPLLLVEPVATCPVGNTVARGVDLIWGNLEEVSEPGAIVSLGTVFQLVCDGTAAANLVDNLKPDEGEADFFLYREAGEADYGTSSAGSPRLPDAGDCP